MLEKYTDKQLLDWYNSYLLSEAKKSGLTNIPNLHGGQSLLRHDLWSLYDYGDIIKVVYFKSLPNAPDPRKDPLFPDPNRKRPQFEKIMRSEDERFNNSVSRSKARVFELAMCNEFTHFCTFTQDKKLRDRFNLADFRKDFAQMVRNINRDRTEDEKIKYLLIPEQHKDGAWHMHGLFMGLNDSDLRLFKVSERIPERIKKQLRQGVKIYDWTRYRQAFGYFTCTEIESGTACAKYITKYISKDLQKNVRKSGEHLFFASQGLKGREVIVKKSSEVCPIEKWDFENQYIKVVEIPKSDKRTEKNTELKI